MCVCPWKMNMNKILHLCAGQWSCVHGNICALHFTTCRQTRWVWLRPHLSCYFTHFYFALLSPCCLAHQDKPATIFGSTELFTFSWQMHCFKFPSPERKIVYVHCSGLCVKWFTEYVNRSSGLEKYEWSEFIIMYWCCVFLKELKKMR